MTVKKHRHHQHVTSSTVQSIAYDPTEKVMEVQFKSGALYEYLNIEPEMFDYVQSSPSKGKALHEVVKTHKGIRIR
jgi:KTSC domain